MRLLLLYIKDYKNIQDQTFDFSDNTGYIALIGLNGSGKSNLLEAISLIFDDLYEIPHLEQVNGYRITYKIGEQEYTYTTLNEQNNIIPLAKEERTCPSSVIACYSGEDLRLWDMAYMPYYMSFFSEALHGKDYVPKTMYVNKYCWKIALISLLFSLNREVQQFVKDVLHIDVANVTVQFTYKDIANPQPHDAYNWLERIKQQYGTNDIPIENLRDFGLGNTLHTDLTEDKLVFFYLYFLSMPSKSSRQPVDKLITNINIKFGTFEFDSLSEGEKKMILIACITQLLGDENSLVLLDEPDAHVHIEYKKKMLDAITSFDGQTVFTTHSPVLANQIQKGNKNNIVLLKDGQRIDTDPINKLEAISGEDIDFISSSVVVGSKFVLVVEGISDVRCLTKAIEVWSRKDAKYKKLESIKLLSAGGSGDVKEIFTDVLLSQIDYIEKIVFLFDIDEAGKKGHEKIEELKNEEKYRQYAPKVTTVYYNEDITLNFELEDLFPKEVYSHIVEKLRKLETYRDFKNRSKKTTSEIKDYIKDKASTFQDDWYDGFKSILDKLLTSFSLN